MKKVFATFVILLLIIFYYLPNSPTFKLFPVYKGKPISLGYGSHVWYRLEVKSDSGNVNNLDYASICVSSGKKRVNVTSLIEKDLVIVDNSIIGIKLKREHLENAGLNIKNLQFEFNFDSNKFLIIRRTSAGGPIRVFKNRVFFPDKL